MTNLFKKMFIEYVDLDIELSLGSNLQQSEPSAPWLRIIHVSALIAVVSARSPPLEVRSIQDCDERTEVLLGSNGEADHHQIDCLKCCDSHGDSSPDRLGLLAKFGVVQVFARTRRCVKRYLKVFELLADGPSKS